MNDYRVIRYLKYCIYYIFRVIVIFEYNIYILFKNLKKRESKKINRLFATTGNISLINTITLINEIGDKHLYDDILFIDTGKGREEFVNTQLEIAKLHKFKKIIVGYQLSSGVEAVLHNIFKVDEVFLLNHPAHTSTIIPLYKQAKFILIDEGPASLIAYDKQFLKQIKVFKTHRYLNKLDFCGLDNIDLVNFGSLDLNEFRKIANTISEKYPLTPKYKAKDKAILYCGIYWEVSGLDRKSFIKLQNETINNLLKAGYKILYKPHPRDTEFYGLDKNPNVEFINTRLPIELYKLDILAVVSISSTASLSYAHYWQVPSFSNVTPEAIQVKSNKVLLNLVRFIVNEYSPNYSELLDLDVKNRSSDMLAQDIMNIYNTFMASKPLLSKNISVNKYLN